MNRRLTLKNVGKSFGAVRALEGVSVEWDEGASVALVGANGGGKSTLLKVLAGVTQPDTGQVDGLEAFTISYLPDRLAFARGWTAWSWLTMTARWKKASPGRVDEVLAEAGLTDAARKPVATFSQGMLRRLLYAQTRLTDADLVLLDEPEGGLDPLWLVRLEQEFQRIRQEGRTLLFSTHLVDLAAEFADELLVLSGGRVVAREKAAEWKALDPVSRRHRLATLMEAQKC